MEWGAMIFLDSSSFSAFISLSIFALHMSIYTRISFWQIAMKMADNDDGLFFFQFSSPSFVICAHLVFPLLCFLSCSLHFVCSSSIVRCASLNFDTVVQWIQIILVPYFVIANKTIGQRSVAIEMWSVPESQQLAIFLIRYNASKFCNRIYYYKCTYSIP